MQPCILTITELLRLAVSYEDGVEARRSVRRFREIEANGGCPVIETVDGRTFTVYDLECYNHIVKIMAIEQLPEHSLFRTLETMVSE